MARIFRDDERGRGEHIDRAVRDVPQIADGGAHQEQGARRTGAHAGLAATLRYAACFSNFSASAGLPTKPMT